MKKTISSELYHTLKELMNEDLLKEFNLGGGTNLAIKYNHRVSVDIDLFSQKIIGKNKIHNINDMLKEKYKDYKFLSNVKNKNSEDLSFIKSVLKVNDKQISIDIIQNLPLNHSVKNIDGIRLIDDLDIGALKLISAANRGTRKDFYDIFILKEKYTFKKLYEELLLRYNKFKNIENIFSTPDFKPKEDLKKDLTPLGNFNKASDLSRANNKIKLPIINKPFVLIKKSIINDVKLLAKEKGLKFEETTIKRKNKIGFSY